MSIANDILALVDLETGVPVNYRVVTEWYDGSAMTDAKADGVIYRKKDNTYYQKQLGVYNSLFLEKDSIADLRAMSDTDILLFKMGYWKGVRLNGYYVKGDTPNSLEYYWEPANTDADDGGATIALVNSVTGRFVCDFVDAVDFTQFGSKGDNSTDNSTALTNLFSYLRTKSATLPISSQLPTVTFSGVHVFVSTLHWDFDGLSITGNGIRNSVLAYNGTGTAIEIGDGTNPVRYLDISGFALRSINATSQRGLNIRGMLESTFKDLWILGNANVGFTEYSLSLGAGTTYSCFTDRFTNVRVTNTTGIGFLLQGGGHNAVFFINCSASKNDVNRWIESCNGCKFVNFQTEGANTGIETRISPYGPTDARIGALTLANEYCETLSGSAAGRLYYITNLDNTNTRRNLYCYGLDLISPYFWGAAAADYAIELDVTTGLLLGNLDGGFFQGVQKAVVKSELATERLGIKYVRPLDGFMTGNSKPIIESISGLTGCVGVQVNSGFVFTKALPNGSYVPFNYIRYSGPATVTLSNTSDFQHIEASSTGGAVTLTLPAASAVGYNIFKKIEKINTATTAVTINPNGSDTINSAATPITLTGQFEYVLLVRSSSTNWIILERGVIMNRAAPQAAITTADGTDAATTQTLANDTKAKVNAIIAALKTAGVMAN